MRSIFFAMLRDAVQRGRWILPLGFLAGNLLPVLLFTAFAKIGVKVTNAPDWLFLHLMVTHVSIMSFAPAIMFAQGPPNRLFTFPVSNRRLVAYYLLIAGSLMIAQIALSQALINAIFGLDWPIQGPALFGGAALALVYAVIWFADRSAWFCPALILLVAPAAVWHKTRYGDFLPLPTRSWQGVTVVELLTLSAMALIAFAFAAVGVGRMRSGESPFSVGFIDWVKRWFDRSLEAGPAFSSPAEAQVWFERTKKAGVLPWLVVFGLVVGVGGWLIFDRNLDAIYHGMTNGGWMLLAAGMICGLIYGSGGATDSNPEMGPFLGTRPMTSKDMANTILKLAARDVALGWLIWLGATVALHLLVEAYIPTRWSWVQIVGPLVGCWIALGIAATLLMVGRLKYFVIAVFSPLGLTMVGAIASSLFLSPRGQQSYNEFAKAAMGIGCAAVTCWSLFAARRANLISTATLLGCLAIWAVVGSLAVAMIHTHLNVRSIADYLQAVGLASLAAAPLATAPLTLAWNRVR